MQVSGISFIVSMAGRNQRCSLERAGIQHQDARYKMVNSCLLSFGFIDAPLNGIIVLILVLAKRNRRKLTSDPCLVESTPDDRGQIAGEGFRRARKGGKQPPDRKSAHRLIKTDC